MTVALCVIQILFERLNISERNCLNGIEGKTNDYQGMRGRENLAVSLVVLVDQSKTYHRARSPLVAREHCNGRLLFLQ